MNQTNYYYMTPTPLISPPTVGRLLQKETGITRLPRSGSEVAMNTCVTWARSPKELIETSSGVYRTASETYYDSRFQHIQFA